MAANDLTIEDVSAVANSLISQATNGTITSVDAKDFATVGQHVLQSARDPLMNALTQMFGATVFQTRPYSAKFQGFSATDQRFGNIKRAISTVARDAVLSTEHSLPANGTSVDHYEIHRPKALEIDFYGQVNLKYTTTIFLEQLDVAFSGLEELQNFVNNVILELVNDSERAQENLSRALLANAIVSKTVVDAATPNESVVHLLTEYNAVHGTTYTATTIRAEDVYPSFVKWAYAKIRTVANLMSASSSLYQTNITGYNVLRHTPIESLRMLISASDKYEIESEVLADVFNPEMLKIMDYEHVDFWQSVDDVKKVIAEPVFLKSDGTLDETTIATTVSNIFGVLSDVDAFGYNLASRKILNTPINADGAYYNMFMHQRGQHWTDFTQKIVVFLMD